MGEERKFMDERPKRRCTGTKNKEKEGRKEGRKTRRVIRVASNTAKRRNEREQEMSTRFSPARGRSTFTRQINVTFYERDLYLLYIVSTIICQVCTWIVIFLPHLRLLRRTNLSVFNN